jgi:hypothetical protein
MARAKKKPTHLKDFWGIPFCRPGVQKVLKEGRNWKLPQPYLGSYLHYTYDTARAFSERPQKRSEEASFFLNDYEWQLNGWFFRLCAAICEGSDRNKWSMVERLHDEYDAGSTTKELAAAYRRTENWISKNMARELGRRQAIIDDWNAWHPSFFRPMPPQKFFQWFESDTKCESLSDA